MTRRIEITTEEFRPGVLIAMLITWLIVYIIVKRDFSLPAGDPLQGKSVPAPATEPSGQAAAPPAQPVHIYDDDDNDNDDTGSEPATPIIYVPYVPERPPAAPRRDPGDSRGVLLQPGQRPKAKKIDYDKFELTDIANFGNDVGSWWKGCREQLYFAGRGLEHPETKSRNPRFFFSEKAVAELRGKGWHGEHEGALACLFLRNMQEGRPAKDILDMMEKLESTSQPVVDLFDDMQRESDGGDVFRYPWGNIPYSLPGFCQRLIDAGIFDIPRLAMLMWNVPKKGRTHWIRQHPLVPLKAVVSEATAWEARPGSIDSKDYIIASKEDQVNLLLGWFVLPFRGCGQTGSASEKLESWAGGTPHRQIPDEMRDNGMTIVEYITLVWLAWLGRRWMMRRVFDLRSADLLDGSLRVSIRPNTAKETSPIPQLRMDVTVFLPTGLPNSDFVDATPETMPSLQRAWHKSHYSSWAMNRIMMEARPYIEDATAHRRDTPEAKKDMSEEGTGRFPYLALTRLFFRPGVPLEQRRGATKRNVDLKGEPDLHRLPFDRPDRLSVIDERGRIAPMLHPKRKICGTRLYSDFATAMYDFMTGLRPHRIEFQNLREYHLFKITKDEAKDKALYGDNQDGAAVFAMLMYLKGGLGYIGHGAVYSDEMTQTVTNKVSQWQEWDKAGPAGIMVSEKPSLRYQRLDLGGLLLLVHTENKLGAYPWAHMLDSVAEIVLPLLDQIDGGTDAKRNQPCTGQVILDRRYGLLGMLASKDPVNLIITYASDPKSSQATYERDEKRFHSQLRKYFPYAMSAVLGERSEGATSEKLAERIYDAYLLVEKIINERIRSVSGRQSQPSTIHPEIKPLNFRYFADGEAETPDQKKAALVKLMGGFEEVSLGLDPGHEGGTQRERSVGFGSGDAEPVPSPESAAPRRTRRPTPVPSPSDASLSPDPTPKPLPAEPSPGPRDGDLDPGLTKEAAMRQIHATSSARMEEIVDQGASFWNAHREKMATISEESELDELELERRLYLNGMHRLLLKEWRELDAELQQLAVSERSGDPPTAWTDKTVKWSKLPLGLAVHKLDTTYRQPALEDARKYRQKVLAQYASTLSRPPFLTHDPLDPRTGLDEEMMQSATQKWQRFLSSQGPMEYKRLNDAKQSVDKLNELRVAFQELLREVDEEMVDIWTKFMEQKVHPVIRSGKMKADLGDDVGAWYMWPLKKVRDTLRTSFELGTAEIIHGIQAFHDAESTIVFPPNARINDMLGRVKVDLVDEWVQRYIDKGQIRAKTLSQAKGAGLEDLDKAIVYFAALHQACWRSVSMRWVDSSQQDYDTFKAFHPEITLQPLQDGYEKVWNEMKGQLDGELGEFRGGTLKRAQELAGGDTSEIRTDIPRERRRGPAEVPAGVKHETGGAMQGEWANIFAKLIKDADRLVQQYEAEAADESLTTDGRRKLAKVMTERLQVFETEAGGRMGAFVEKCVAVRHTPEHVSEFGDGSEGPTFMQWLATSKSDFKDLFDRLDKRFDQIAKDNEASVPARQPHSPRHHREVDDASESDTDSDGPQPTPPPAPRGERQGDIAQPAMKEALEKALEQMKDELSQTSQGLQLDYVGKRDKLSKRSKAGEIEDLAKTTINSFDKACQEAFDRRYQDLFEHDRSKGNMTPDSWAYTQVGSMCNDELDALAVELSETFTCEIDEIKNQ